MSGAQFARSAKSVAADAKILSSEVSAVINKIASDIRYATSLHDAIDQNDRKTVIALLKRGGIKRCRIDALDLFPGNLKVKLTVDFKRMRFSIEVET